jgi:hypothetical protein
MLPRRSRARRRLIALVIISAIALAMVIIGLGGTTGWPLLATGCAVLLVALPGIYVLQRPEIEEASKAAGRGRAIILHRDRPR